MKKQRDAKVKTKEEHTPKNQKQRHKLSEKELKNTVGGAYKWF